MDQELTTCARCHRLVKREELNFSYDCQGIAYRLVCGDCMEEIHEIGYDGEYYDESDECIDDDY